MQKNLVTKSFHNWEFPHNFDMSGANTFFKKNPALSGMTSYGVLKPFENLEKTNDPIPRKQSDRWADGRTDRPYFAGSIRSPSWVQKLLAWSKKTKITLINFMPLVFYTPWKHQKTRGFSGGIERDQRHEIG